MLQELTIQNLALIKKLSLPLQQGFTSLTGETGAGKSILLDGLGLALGERADTSLVRHGEKRADITADFCIENNPAAQQWLIQHELDDDNLCLLRRSLSAEGRSKGYINGLPASIAQLKSLSRLLIDIHGQHEHQSLLNSSKQLELLDSYAQHTDLVHSTAKNYQAWYALNKSYQELLANQEDRQSKIELLNFQKQEFDKVQPQEHEFSDLSNAQNTLSNANEIKQAINQTYQLLEGNNGVAQLLNSAINNLSSVSNFSPQLTSSLEQLNSLLIDCQELASDILQQNNTIELDPAKLQATESRLSDLFNLAKKHQLDPENLVKKHQDIIQSLDNLSNSTESLEQLKQDIDTAWQAYTDSAKALSASRLKHAKALSQTISTSMQTLGMENGQFLITFENAEKPSNKGNDKVSFMVSANKGQPVQPIHKVASGGELSRISLAIQVTCAQVACIPTLIFDEVDVGIGGGIAEVVGQKMQLLGKHTQVLSITHLGQVAAYGKQQLNISKSVTEDSTSTQVVELSSKERVEEIARMVGGMTITEQTLKHAEEILKTAQEFSNS